tara:strand:- start:13493 stop:13801 length:309 start_codon:yes stop_codon:yes gene_type:complete
MATPKTKATKSVSLLAAIWGRDDKEVSAARLATAEKRISVNAQKAVLDLEESVSAYEIELETTLDLSLTNHSFTEIVNAKADLTDAQDRLALAVTAQKEFLG